MCSSQAQDLHLVKATCLSVSDTHPGILLANPFPLPRIVFPSCQYNYRSSQRESHFPNHSPGCIPKFCLAMLINPLLAYQAVAGLPFMFVCVYLVSVLPGVEWVPPHFLLHLLHLMLMFSKCKMARLCSSCFGVSEQPEKSCCHGDKKRNYFASQFTSSTFCVTEIAN